MNRNEALDLLHKNVLNANLRRHCYAVEAVMRSLARRFNQDQDKWGLAGLLHDADYELTKDEATTKHTIVALEWLKATDLHTDIGEAILAHGWGYVENAPQPKNEMQWALYCCDELTGLIVACALVKPERTLSVITPEFVMKKFGERSFAAGANRDQIQMCEMRLGIPLRDFVEIALSSMQGIASDLGL